MSESKSYLEIAIMPMVVAGLGIFGTHSVTSQQNRSTQILSQAQLQSEEKRTRGEQQLKILEIFSEKVVSADVRDRQVAIRILTALDVELATKLASAIAANESEAPEVRTLAREVVTAQASRGYSFPVIGSFTTLNEALARAAGLAGKIGEYSADVYGSENGYFAVTLGGYLSMEEAVRRRDFARKNGLAADAYVRTSRLWSERLN